MVLEEWPLQPDQEVRNQLALALAEAPTTANMATIARVDNTQLVSDPRYGVNICSMTSLCISNREIAGKMSGSFPREQALVKAVEWSLVELQEWHAQQSYAILEQHVSLADGRYKCRTKSCNLWEWANHSVVPHLF